jgi:tetratricopeptide (TPR) repeat protein
LTGFRILLLAVLLALPAAGGAADPASTPDPAAEARAAYRRGADLYKAGKYREAIAAFEAADRLKPSPALQFNIGQAWEKLGDPAAALAAFARYLRLDPAAANRESVQRSVKVLEGRLAATGRQMLHVEVDPPGAEVRVDGVPAGAAPVDAPFAPGPHALAAAAPGRRTATRDVVLPTETSLTVNLILEPGQDPAAVPLLAARPPETPLEATRPEAPPQPAERKNWLGPIIAGSVAVVAAGAGLVMGLQAKSAQDALLAGGNDRAQADALASKASSNATTANVLYGVAGAALITGGMLAIAF